MRQIETYRFLEDEKELKWFYDHAVFPLSKNEEYCFAMAARGKRLDPETRAKYDLGRAEMLNVQVVSPRREDALSFDLFKRGILRFEVNKEAFLTHSNLPYPEETLVCYFYINPCDSIKVMSSLNKKITDLNEEFVHSACNSSIGGIEDTIDKTKAMLHKVNRMYPTCPSHKHLLDFDMDLEDTADREFVVQLLKQEFSQKFNKGRYFIVKTSGGFHILIFAEDLKFNPNEFTARVEAMVGKEFCKEFVLNKNGFIPCPGTLQYGNLVRVLNKEDFDE